MPEDFDEIIDEESREEIDYVSLGKAMRKIRSAAGMTQEAAAKIFLVSRTVYTKYETGKIHQNATQKKIKAKLQSGPAIAILISSSALNANSLKSQILRIGSFFILFRICPKIAASENSKYSEGYSCR